MTTKKEGDVEQYVAAGRADLPKLVRYCTDCSTVGDVGPEFVNCCPTPEISHVTEEVAKQAKAGFKALYCPTNGT